MLPHTRGRFSRIETAHRRIPLLCLAIKYLACQSPGTSIIASGNWRPAAVTALLAGETGRAFLEKGAHAFLTILGAESLREQVRFQRAGGEEIEISAAPHRLPDEPHRDRALGCDQARPPEA